MEYTFRDDVSHGSPDQQVVIAIAVEIGTRRADQRPESISFASSPNSNSFDASVARQVGWLIGQNDFRPEFRHVPQNMDHSHGVAIDDATTRGGFRLSLSDGKVEFLVAVEIAGCHCQFAANRGGSRQCSLRQPSDVDVRLREAQGWCPHGRQWWRIRVGTCRGDSRRAAEKDQQASLLESSTFDASSDGEVAESVAVDIVEREDGSCEREVLHQRRDVRAECDDVLQVGGKGGIDHEESAQIKSVFGRRGCPDRIDIKDAGLIDQQVVDPVAVDITCGDEDFLFH